jgi:hypothetical protein
MRGSSRFAIALCAGIMAVVPLVGPLASGSELKECSDNSPVAAGLPNNPGVYPMGVGAECSLTFECPTTGGFCTARVEAVITGLGVVEGGLRLEDEIWTSCTANAGHCVASAEIPQSGDRPLIITCFARAVLAIDVDVSCAGIRP